MEEIMKLQTDILNLLEEKTPEYYRLLKSYIEEIEDNRVSNRNANERILDQIEKLVIKEQYNDN